MNRLKKTNRWDFEKNLVAKFYPGFSAHGLGSKAYFSGWTGRNSRTYDYKLRLELPPAYPFEKPALYVESPRRLLMHDRCTTINSLGTSHNYHTYNNGAGGCVKICFASDWDASFNCVMVLLRGMIWIDGYENHLRTGETIATYIERLKEKLRKKTGTA